MKAIHAILRAIRAFAGVTGNPKLAVEASAADLALTGAETVAPVVVSELDKALAAFVSKVTTHGTDGAHTVFVGCPANAQITPTQYHDYVNAIRDALLRDEKTTGTPGPRIVMLPPGLTMDVVKGTAKEFEHAIEYLQSLDRNVMSRGLSRESAVKNAWRTA